MKAIEEAKNLFDSILCLRSEGIEFYTSTQILDAIEKEAKKGFDVCNKALQPEDSADKCDCPLGDKCQYKGKMKGLCMFKGD